jgi:hypothetical protein
MLPEMSTLCPSVEGFGEEAMVRLDEHAVAPQHVVAVPQHVVAVPQHTLAVAQQTLEEPDLCAPCTGVGQQGTIPVRCGQAIADVALAVAAGVDGPSRQIEASRTKSDE